MELIRQAQDNYQKKKKKKFNIYISYGTINLWLRKLLKKPIKTKKTFYLKGKDKKRRLEFYEMIKNKNIPDKDIFFRDEKRSILNPPLNKQTNQIRLIKNIQRELWLLQAY